MQILPYTAQCLPQSIDFLSSSCSEISYLIPFSFVLCSSKPLSHFVQYDGNCPPPKFYLSCWSRTSSISSTTVFHTDAVPLLYPLPWVDGTCGCPRLASLGCDYAPPVSSAMFSLGQSAAGGSHPPEKQLE